MTFEAFAKCFTGCLICIGFGAGCAASTTKAVSPGRHWLPGYVFGLWGKADIDLRDDCPKTGAASIRLGPTWSTLVVSVVTLGMYTPREVRVLCEAPP